MVQHKPDLTDIRLLIIDPKPSPLGSLSRYFESLGGKVTFAKTIEDAANLLDRNNIQVVLIAIHPMGKATCIGKDCAVDKASQAGKTSPVDKSSVQVIDEASNGLVKGFVKRLLKRYESPGRLFYLIGTDSSADTIPDLFTDGIEDYLHFGIEPERFAQMVELRLGRLTGNSTALAVVDPLVVRLRPYFQFRSPAMYQALANLPGIAASSQTVLISGETGVGKEIVARAIHVLSKRADGPFFAVNCGAIPEGLIEDELFGHEKGAFTGATSRRLGKFEGASGGTLFLDEIGDMPMLLQVRLLRVLEDNQLYRVGGEKPVPIDVRVIAATRIDLYKAVEDGLFREDLYYRLNVLRVHLPPLRQRLEDIPYLALYFLGRAFAEMGIISPYPSLSPATIDLLEQLPWKGNVRELRNVMTRVATLLPQDITQVLPIHVYPHLEDRPKETVNLNMAKDDSGICIPLGTPLARAEDIIIRHTLNYTGGNRTKTARLLNIGLRTLRRKLNN
ncbi:MAG: sigma-54-dependent Fis family transcriptional regulator [Nitrospirae bacterium]|nr:sigma-54-dependent Fis family transcriptional regulator [Nitrospirota bacterium]